MEQNLILKEVVARLYFLNSVISSKGASHSLKEWHEVFGHCNKRDMMKLTDAVVGMNIVDNADFECEICVEGKMTQHRNREPDRRADSILQFVHRDIAGPIDPITKDGFQCVLGFIDDYSNLLMVYFLK